MRVSAARLMFVVAIAAVAVVVTAKQPAAATRPWVWTKAMAEYYVGGNIGLATACSPIGAPYRSGGRNYYYTFSCVVVFRSGDRYGIKIKPTGAKTYATLTVVKLGNGGSTTGGTYLGTGSGHWISRNSSGNVITLEDRSTWLISPLSRIDTILWLPIDDITVLSGTYPGYGYRLVNTDEGEVADARFLGYG